MVPPDGVGDLARPVRGLAAAGEPIRERRGVESGQTGPSVLGGRDDREAVYPVEWLDLSRANLRNANLTNACLAGANLREANLSGTCMIGTRLATAVLAVSDALVGTALPATVIDTVAPDGAAAANAIDVASRAPAASPFSERRTSPSLR